MKHELEEYLIGMVILNKHLHVRDIIQYMLDEGFIENPKQAYRSLEKWAGWEIYDYGVCLDLGWFYDGSGNLPVRYRYPQ